jgi:poly(hydroxyalkanoate) depolymerase family esterase
LPALHRLNYSVLPFIHGKHMNLKIPAQLIHATRLVRNGKLMAATTMIQRALRADFGPSATPADAPGAIDGSFRVVDATAPASKPGQFVGNSYTNSAGTRGYKTYIPANYGGQALPLVVMLHGCKQGPDDFAAATRMNELADEHGFIVVYPGQARRANVSSCWNWFQVEHQQRDRGEPSLVAGITRQVLSAYAADDRRVYVAGLSAGGAMAAVMGATYPDLYAAVGIHSGLAYAAACDVPSAFAAMRGQGPKRPPSNSCPSGSVRTVPTIVFHGDNDTTVHPNNGDELIARAAPDVKAGSEENSADERTVERGSAGGRPYTRTVYRDAAGTAVMEQWLVHGAAHAWSGGSARGSFSDPAGPNASREMLRFFLGHQIT